MHAPVYATAVKPSKTNPLISGLNINQQEHINAIGLNIPKVTYVCTMIQLSKACQIKMMAEKRT